MDVMIDLETLGTRPDAMIIQLGAVPFEATSGGRILQNKAFCSYILIQDGAGSWDHSTLSWWLQEPSSGQMGFRMQQQAKPLEEVLTAFDRWPAVEFDIDWPRIGTVWADPSEFDMPILKSAYARFGRSVPWDRRATRDARTLHDLAIGGGGKPEVDQVGTTHDAVDDCIFQCMQVQKSMEILGK